MLYYPGDQKPAPPRSPIPTSADLMRYAMRAARSYGLGKLWDLFRQELHDAIQDYLDHRPPKVYWRAPLAGGEYCCDSGGTEEEALVTGASSCGTMAFRCGLSGQAIPTPSSGTSRYWFGIGYKRTGAPGPNQRCTWTRIRRIDRGASGLYYRPTILPIPRPNEPSPLVRPELPDLAPFPDLFPEALPIQQPAPDPAPPRRRWYPGWAPDRYAVPGKSPFDPERWNLPGIYRRPGVEPFDPGAFGMPASAARPGPGLVPGMTTIIDPSTDAPVQPQPGVEPRKDHPGRVKEKKMKPSGGAAGPLNSAFRKLRKAADAYEKGSEVKDFVEALHDALPKGCRKHKSIPGMLQDIYNCFDNMDWADALENVLWNEFSDRIVGKGIAASNYSARTLGFGSGAKIYNPTMFRPF